MKWYKIAKFASITATIFLLVGCASTPKKDREIRTTPRTLIRLPLSCNTPDGANESLNQPGEVLIRGNELIVVNMGMSWEDITGAFFNEKIDGPYTISVIPLEKDNM